MIDRSQIDDLRRIADLRVIAAQFLPIKKVPSGNAIARCCFHEEDTPSLTFWKTHFVCFGCGARGDIFGFIQKAKVVSFGGAIRYLADVYGVELSEKPVSRARATIAAEVAAHCQWWWDEQRKLLDGMKATAYQVVEDEGFGAGWDWFETVAGIRRQIDSVDDKARYAIFRTLAPDRADWRASIIASRSLQRLLINMLQSAADSGNDLSNTHILRTTTSSL